MASASTYSVIVSGQIQDGVDPLKIQEALAALLKVPPEKAASLMSRKWTIKKDVDEQTAAVYKQKLESIGLIIGLKEHAPPPPTDGGFTLALEPSAEELQAQQSQKESASQAPADQGSVTCPKCNTEQPTGTEQCQGCGVFLNKVLKQPGQSESTLQPQTANEEDGESTSTVLTEETLTGKSIAAGAIAALFGAIVWNIIGSVFDYELGIVAWGIGGAVGFAVAVTGGSGDKAAMICAALALLAILGGKYMLYSGFKEDISQLVADNIEDVRTLYEAQMQTVDAFENVTDDQSMRQFMVDYQYSDSASADEVTDEEINLFKTEIEPMITNNMLYRPSFEEWTKSTFEDQMNDISTVELIKENFGFLDLVFIFLGVGTAFRLGRGATE